MTRYSCCSLPAFRTLRVASFAACPITPCMINCGVAVSTNLVSSRSWMHFGAMAPRFTLPVPVDMPHDQDSTSISSLCLESWDSPLMPLILRNMSLAETTLVDEARLVATRPAATRPLKPLLLIVNTPALGVEECVVYVIRAQSDSLSRGIPPGRLTPPAAQSPDRRTPPSTPARCTRQRQRRPARWSL